MKKLPVLLLILLASVLVFLACEHKGQSRGNVRNIVVVADSTLWAHVDTLVMSQLSPERFTPQPEYIFALNQIPPSDLGRLKRYSQVLFVGTLDMGGQTQNLLDQMLPPDSPARQLVQSGERFFFPVAEPWSRDQLLGVLVAKDQSTLIEQLKYKGDLLFETFDAHANKRAKKMVYYREYQKDLTKQLMDSLGWSVNVPLEWIIAINNTDSNFVWMRKMNPQREFFVHWQQVDDPSILSRQWVAENRNRLTADFYEGDYIYSDSMITVREKTVDFNGRYAIRLEGIWQNDSLNIGGPFRTYGFYNESDGRMYLIDESVFAPEERKWPFLRQLDAVAHTFKTRDELKEKQEK